MLYFSKIKIITVFFITIILTYLSFSNLFKFDDNFLKNKINLGLDLRGGSYLLLEIDNQPIISQTLQNKLIDLKKFFNNKSLKVKNFSIEDNKILFESDNLAIKQVQELLLDKDHPQISKYLTDGERVAYGARALTKGGLQSQPKMSMPGGLLIGDNAGTLNSAKIKGSHGHAKWHACSGSCRASY